MMDKKERQLKCVELLMKTYTELGQTPNEETVMSMSLLLAEDLEIRYKNMTWDVVELAFRNGVRNTDLFHINVQTMNTWLRTTRDDVAKGYYNLKQGSNHLVSPEIKQILNNQKLIE